MINQFYSWVDDENGKTTAILTMSAQGGGHAITLSKFDTVLKYFWFRKRLIW